VAGLAPRPPGAAAGTGPAAPGLVGTRIRCGV